MKRIFLLLALAAGLNAKGQTIPRDVSFKAPEVSAFNKHVETPVSYFTGVPSISIPLYEIKVKDLTVPVSLDYHSGGIRVDDEATWVGLGWSLNYGPQISRKTRGMRDEQHFFRTAQPEYTSIEDYLALDDIYEDNYLVDRQFFMSDAKRGLTDYMPDEFYYNALGHSGRFMYNQPLAKFVFFPKDDISVNYTSTDVNSYGFHTGDFHIDLWNMKLPNGVSLQFGGNAASQQKSISQVDYIKSAWQIRSITNAYGENIAYNYEPLAYSIDKLASEEFSRRDQVTTSVITTNQFKEAVLQSISLPGGHIVFTTASREDMPGRRLTEMVVVNEHNVTIKKIKFYYSYFYGTFASAPMLNYVSNDYKYKRLKLDSLEISAGDMSPVKYRFEYNTTNPQGIVPSKYSYAQDFWGYFNGVYNTTLVPYMNHPEQTGGGQRHVNIDYAKIFSLKSIQYPEGGKTEFEFESNVASSVGGRTYFLMSAQSQAYFQRSAVIGAQGWDRNSFTGTQPDVTSNGVHTFKKQFTVNPSGGPTVANGFNCVTNFGGTLLDGNNIFCSNNNVEFRLEKIDGTRTLIKEFISRNCATNTFTGSNSEAIALMPGTYEMTLIIKYTGVTDPANIAQAHQTTFSIQWMEWNTSTTAQQVNVGGLRIKEIKNYSSDGILATHRKFSYLKPWSDGTSGKIMSWPKHYQYNYKSFGSYPDGSPNHYMDIRFYATSVTPLGTTGGSYCGYEYVKEELVAANPADNLVTERTFSFIDPMYDQIYINSDEAVVDAKEWLRGKLLNVKYLKHGLPVQEEIYTYKTHSPHLQGPNDEDYIEEINTDYISNQAISAHKFYLPEDFFDVTGSISYYDNPLYAGIDWKYGLDTYGHIMGGHAILPHFKRRTSFDKPATKTTITYDDFGRSITQTETFYYGSTPIHHQVTKQESTNSKGELIKTEMKYAPDMGTTAPYPSINAVNAVVETSKYKGSTLLMKNKINYSQFPLGNILPSSTQTQIGAGSLKTDVLFNAFDIYGNILEQQKANDIKISYLWDPTAGQYPVAEVVNASQTDIAYTSFEKPDLVYSGLGNWSFVGYANRYHQPAPMGEYTLPTTSGTTISKSNLTASVKYIVSYWSKAGQYTVTGTQTVTQGQTLHGWTNYTHEVTGVTTVSVTKSTPGYIDELRLYPKTAIMTTYAYQPLVGMTTKCDVFGRFMRYEYDELGRLILIRDHDNNILKKICYNYHGQPEDCNIFYSDERSQIYSRNNCGSGYVGSSVTYTIPAGRYRSTVSQAAANALAQAEVDANGQLFANATGTCTVICHSSNCSGVNKKCLGNVCETGIKVYTSIVQISAHMWECTYHYEWGDGSWSQNYTETSPWPCIGEVE